MKKTKLLSVTIVASIAAMVTFYFIADRYRNSDTGNILESKINSAASEVTSAEILNPDLPTVKQVILRKSTDSISASMIVSSEFESSNSAEDAMAAINRAYNLGETKLAIQLEAELHSRCGFSVADFEPPFAETNWAYDNLLGYCSSYSPNMTKQELDKLSKNVRFTTAARASNLFKKYLELDQAEVESDFVNRMANASSVDDIYTGRKLLRLMQNSGIPISIDPNGYQYTSPAQAQKVTFAALQMYSCYRFGGCESDNYLVTKVCVFLAQCMPGWSMTDYYTYMMSPAELEIATRIFMFLYNNQIDG